MQLNIQHVNQFLLQVLVLHRGNRFNTAIQIAPHPVGRAQKNQRLSVVSEIPHPCMLQETVHNTRHPDIPAELLTRYQATDSPHNQVNLHPCLTGTIQFVYHGQVLKGIHLQNDTSLLPLSGQRHLMMNQMLQFRQQVETGHQQTLEVRFLYLLAQIAEQIMQILHQYPVTGIQSYIRINLGCLLVEISRTDVRIAPDRLPLGIVTQHQCQFRMHLQSRYTEKNLNPCLAHQFGSRQIVLLIKTRLQFHKHRYPLAVLSCRNQGIDHLRMLGHTILGNHDLTAHRIVNRLIQETDKMIETVIRIMQEQVLPGNTPVHEMRTFQSFQPHGSRFPERLYFRVRIRQVRQILQVQVPVSRHQFLRTHLKRLHQKRQKVSRHVPVVHKTGNGTDFPFLDLLLQLLHHVFGRHIVHKDIGIPRNLAAITAFHLITDEHFLQIGLYNVFQEHQIEVLSLFRQFDKTAHLAVRHFKDIILPLPRLLTAHPNCQVKTPVAQEHPHTLPFNLYGLQKRKNLFQEKAADERTVILVQVFRILIKHHMIALQFR